MRPSRLALTTVDTDVHDLRYVGGFHGWPYWEHALDLVLPEVVTATT